MKIFYNGIGFPPVGWTEERELGAGAEQGAARNVKSPMNHRSQTITAVVVTRNPGPTLERCLDSLKWVDERIVVDRGSHDGSLAIARKRADKVFYHPSQHDSIVWEYALAAASSDWVLWLEPNEWVEEMLRHEIDGMLLAGDSMVDGYAIPHKVYFQGTWLKNGGLYPNAQLRLFRKSLATVQDQAGQAAVFLSGTVGQLEHPLGVEPFETVHQLFDLMNQHSSQQAALALEAGTRDGGPVSSLVSAKWAFLDRWLLKRGCADGPMGLTLAMAEAYKTFLISAKLRAWTRPGA
jgi:hypothetical protein